MPEYLFVKVVIFTVDLAGNNSVIWLLHHSW
jgi:hypothetical protein